MGHIDTTQSEDTGERPVSVSKQLALLRSILHRISRDSPSEKNITCTIISRTAKHAFEEDKGWIGECGYGVSMNVFVGFLSVDGKL